MPVKTPPEVGNWLPALPSVGSCTGQLIITGSSGIEVIHKKEVTVQVVPDSIQIVPIVYVYGGSKDSVYAVVVVHGDGGCISVDIGNSSYAANPRPKRVASIWSRHEVDHCSFAIQKHSLSRFGDVTVICTGDEKPEAVGLLVDRHVPLPAQEGIGIIVNNIPGVGRVACVRITDSDYVPSSS